MLNLFSVALKYYLSNRLVSIQSLCYDKRYVARFLSCFITLSFDRL